MQPLRLLARLIPYWDSVGWEWGMVVNVASGHELALHGRLDVHSVTDVRTALHAAIDAGDGDLVIDVSGVELVDATGLGMLVGADRRAKLRGRRVVLRAAGPRFLRIIRATRLHRVLTLESGLPA